METSINLFEKEPEKVTVIDVYFFDVRTKALIGKGTALSNDIPENATTVAVSLTPPQDRVWCWNEELNTWIAKHIKQVEGNTDEPVVDVYIYDRTTFAYQYKDTVLESKQPSNSTPIKPSTPLDYFHNDHWVVPGSNEDLAIKAEKEHAESQIPVKRTPKQNEDYLKQLNQKTMSNIQMLNILVSAGIPLDPVQEKLLADCNKYVATLMVFRTKADFNDPYLKFPPEPENFNTYL